MDDLAGSLDEFDSDGEPNENGKLNCTLTDKYSLHGAHTYVKQVLMFNLYLAIML